MTVSEFVISFLEKKGIKDIFLVSGGGIMYLLDAIYRNKNIRYCANFHEQASATCAESYARMKNGVSACVVTSGPGGTNAITGVAAAWVDSIPMIVISGQVKKEIIADYTKSRQKGPQEINIIDMVKPITKYAVQLLNPSDVQFNLQKAFYEATSGRPGPVWISIPLDVQNAEIEKSSFTQFIPPRKKNIFDKKQFGKLTKLLKESSRPLIIAGNGIRLAGGIQILHKFINNFKVPVVTDENGLDMFSEDLPSYMGRYGPKGQRRANFVLQNSDLIISIGASLNVASTGFNRKDFGRNAKIIMVNIDKSELEKDDMEIDLKINTDAAFFLKKIYEISRKLNVKFDKKWARACSDWKNRYGILDPLHLKKTNYVNSYYFVYKLSELLMSENTVVTGMGQDIVSIIQSFKIKKNQRLYVNKNFGQMGWCLPAGIGACLANNRKKTIVVTGDGSFQFNIQELSTISFNKLPLKIFVFNNEGYKSIRDTQNNLFKGRLVGADKNTGVINPDFKDIASAYKLKYYCISNNDEVEKKIRDVLKNNSPALCEVNIEYNQERIPRTSTYQRKDGILESRPLEDLYPFLDRKEFNKNMNLFKK